MVHFKGATFGGGCVETFTNQACTNIDEFQTQKPDSLIITTELLSYMYTVSMINLW